MRCTVRTSRSPPCKPGTVPIAATAAARPLSPICRRRRLHSTHAHLRVTTIRHHSITFTPGDAAACSRMPTVISLTHSDLTHAVPLTLGRSLTHGCSHTRAVSGAYVTPPTQGASFTHTGCSLIHRVLGSTHPGTLVTTPLTHGGALTPFTTHTGTITLGIRSPLRLPGPPYPPSSSCTRQQHSPPQLRLARPNPPGRESPQGGILPPLVPGGGYPAACTGSRDIPRARPHCPPLPPCVCVFCSFNPVCIV